MGKGKFIGVEDNKILDFYKRAGKKVEISKRLVKVQHYFMNNSEI